MKETKNYKLILNHDSKKSIGKITINNDCLECIIKGIKFELEGSGNLKNGKIKYLSLNLIPANRKF